VFAASADSTGLYALATDITELRSSHERIRNLAQRLETVCEDERKKVSWMLDERVAQSGYPHSGEGVEDRALTP